ncbi:2,3-diaminopropionate biosynthesis protein SbnA [Pleomorphovibrio marinus]|uniref:2,3-diaminopropionate biosynthesis protein SbnA n=1 Tax=Pleomorphovibrio marinus TaxID=2164132 RepID=UPI000E0AF4AB|nr:2,3-diaminopropionate biosynthesis protein SbnA [Pleomorphovibrio marinus]
MILTNPNDLAEGVPSLIGNTGLIRLSRLFPEKQVYGKLELMNPAGSIKDRTSKFIIEESLKSGLITKDSLVVESTSGNMGVGLAQICLYYGLKLRLVVDPYINKQTLHLLTTYGAEIEKMTEPDDSGSYLNARINRVQELLAKLPNAFWTRQYENILNPLAHHQTAREIVHQLGSEPDYLLAATSTCGTLMGMADFCNRYLRNTKVIPVDAYGSVIFGGRAAKRVIPGFGASKISPLLNQELLEPPLIMEEWESIVGCKKLLQKEAILAGGSTGALVAAMDSVHLNSDQKAVIIICDRGERYMETIYSDQWIKKTYGEETFERITQAVNESMVQEPVC